MPFCTYCGTSFTRDEHLERHILTHTNIKPFKCFECHMSFARRDLLQRHFTVHGKDQNNQDVLPPNNGMIPKSAGRTPIACTNCAKTKTKCDKKFPCSRCASRNLTCTMRPTRRVSKQVSRAEHAISTSQAQPPQQAQEQQEKQQGSKQHSQEISESIRVGTPPQSDESQEGSEPCSSPEESPRMGPLPDPVIQVSFQNPTPEHDQTHNFEEPTPFFHHSPETTHQTVLSSLVSPQNKLSNHHRMASYDNFLQSSGANQNMDEASPPFLMDWTQIQMPGNFMPQMMIAEDMGFDMCGMTTGAGADAMMSTLPEFHQPLPHVPTPLQTPRMDSFVGDIDFSCSTNSAHSITFPQIMTPAPPTTRYPSVSDSGVADLNAVVAAQDGWTVFRCSPPVPPQQVPRTARANLERLEASLKNHEVWASWRPNWEDGDFIHEQLAVMQLHESTRDKLLAITQTFLHKALEIHRDGATTPNFEVPFFGSSNFVLLPPARVLECFLRSYASSFETFFPLSHRGIVDANELLSSYNDKAGSLLVLMMIAQGAMVMPSAEARALTGGLTEACRISLFDAIEKNISLASDAAVLRAALLFIVQAAWSGDKWQMDIAMGQRGMYLAMLRHSGMLHESASTASTSPSTQNGLPDGLWREWIAQESRSRLIYSWVMVDQDLSFFADSGPMLNVGECTAPMPDNDRLWHAKTAREWTDAFHSVHGLNENFAALGSKTRPLSLQELFRRFLDDDLHSQTPAPTPLQLRLLLHPLQSLVCQYTQLLSCRTDTYRTRTGSPHNTSRPSSSSHSHAHPSSSASSSASSAVSTAAVRVRQEEVSALLARWYALATAHLAQHPICATMQASFVIFHLLALNAVSNFAAIEKLARREGVDGSYAQLLWLHRTCITDVQEAIFHAGQVLRLVRSMPRSVRPMWWPGAVYRVALVLWVDALRHNHTHPPGHRISTGAENGGVSPTTTTTARITGGKFGPSKQQQQQQQRLRSQSVSAHMPLSIAVDALPADHPLLLTYLKKREGAAVLTARDGSFVPLDNAFTVVSHCVDVLDEGIPTRLSEGIRGKLERLARG